MVANTVQSAAMGRNSNVVPRQMNVTESNKTDRKLSVGDAEGLQQLYLWTVFRVQTDIVKPKRQPVLQLQVAKTRNHRAKFAATLGLSEVLAKALRAATVSRSLNYVI
ncbi:unnamed protein product [Macrosiphum euphorbiae]|uniref:Uncharacterized protein n=1 Tax=Macrosiphum euphorbiae TaxID=13131 RepID=A0AAV0W1D3_9HEMI|nr:unnamed protein product [Macrosiphum euphorbiae]